MGYNPLLLLFYCSHCLTCDHLEILLVDSHTLSKCPHHFWSIPILSGITRYSRLLLCVPQPRIGISYFSTEPLFFFIGGCYLENNIWKLISLFLLSIILVSVNLQKYMCINTYVHTYVHMHLYFFLYLSFNLSFCLLS